MKTIKTKEEIIENIQMLEKYLCEGTLEEKDFAIKLIKKGRCFVTYKINEEIRFCPSRFVGYKSNNLTRHINYLGKDGRETNPVITKVLKTKLNPNEELKELHENYCLNIGVSPDNVKKKFWNIDSETAIVIKDENLNISFPEGAIIERIHLHRERNQKVIEIAKNNFKSKHGKLFCQICEFDFAEQYGKIGNDFIEGHHTIPVSEMKPNHQTKPEDIAIVCANCHRMLHRKRPWISITDLKNILK